MMAGAILRSAQTCRIDHIKLGDGSQTLAVNMIARHGLIAGATGTGKSVTMQTIAERASQLGIASLMVDIKGDLAREWRLPLTVQTPAYKIGPALLSRLIDASEAQEAILTIAMSRAVQPPVTIDDIISLIEPDKSAGGAIIRRLEMLALRSDLIGPEHTDITKLAGTVMAGYGRISVLDATKLFNDPAAFAVTLTYILTALAAELPEIGNGPPKLMLMLDEAHVMFDSPALIAIIERTVRMIRSKGVGIYFITQSPADIPDAIAGQLGNRIIHSLRAYTPKQLAGVRTAAATFRANPDIDTATAITNLQTGEALVSMLQDDGSPAPVEKMMIDMI